LYCSLSPTPNTQAASNSDNAFACHRVGTPERASSETQCNMDEKGTTGQASRAGPRRTIMSRRQSCSCDDDEPSRTQRDSRNVVRSIVMRQQSINLQARHNRCIVLDERKARPGITTAAIVGSRNRWQQPQGTRRLLLDVRIATRCELVACSDTCPTSTCQLHHSPLARPRQHNQDVHSGSSSLPNVCTRSVPLPPTSACMVGCMWACRLGQCLYGDMACSSLGGTRVCVAVECLQPVLGCMWVATVAVCQVDCSTCTVQAWP
jgi:hypothetical protein